MPSISRNEPKKFPILIWLIGFVSMIGLFGWINERILSTNQAKTVSEIIKASPEPSLLEVIVQPSLEPSSEIAEEADPYDVMVSIGKDVTDNSNISVFDNKDGSIDVVNNIQLTPEVNIGWGFDASTRKWITGFLSKSYTSGLKIRYVLVTVSFLNTGRPATRAGLGINQANKYTKDEWENITPYELCFWLKQIQIGDNMDPGSPSFNPSNWAFAKNYACD